MQIILREDVPNLGRTGEIVNVRNGFGRNYLIPRGLAVLASTGNRQQLEHEKRLITARERKRLATAAALKSRIEELSLNIPKQVGAEDRLFGSVTSKEIADRLAEQGVTIDRKSIHLPEPIKSLGVHTVQVKLASDVSAKLKVWVVAE
jgi:large subunit ribosomal protein L9